MVIATEAQIIYQPYMKGRSLSHLLFEISRCAGPGEMARDFCEGFTVQNPQLEAQLEALKHLAITTLVTKKRI